MNLRERINGLAEKYLGDWAVKEIHLPKVSPRIAVIGGVIGIELLFNLGCSGTPDLHCLIEADPSLNKAFEKTFQNGPVSSGSYSSKYKIQQGTMPDYVPQKISNWYKPQSDLDRKIRTWERIISFSGNLELKREHLRNMKKEADNSKDPNYIEAYNYLAKEYGYSYR